MKLFNYQQANDSLVYVKMLVENACNMRKHMKELKKQRASNLEIGEIAREIMKELHNIEAVGCRLICFDTGLVQYPWMVIDNHMIYLYWRIGEKNVFARSEDLKILFNNS